MSRPIEAHQVSDPETAFRIEHPAPDARVLEHRARRHARIIELNDHLRTTFKGGRVQMTPGIYDLDARLRGRALCVMSRYNKFDDDSEHDWGVFIFAGYSFEWRIEYRGKDGTGVSPDPADPELTFRVLTLYAVQDVLP